MRLGIQVSIAGKIYQAVQRARSLNCQCMQIFSRNPRSWKARSLNSKDIAEFTQRRRAAGLKPLVVHIPYLINLASPEERLYARSLQAYIADIQRAEQLGAEYFVTHCGSHKGAGEDFGLSRFAAGLNTVLARTRAKVEILLENTAGSGYNLGYTFTHLHKLLTKIEERSCIGLCLDTAHAYAAGFDLAHQEGLEQLLQSIDKLIGLARVKLIHLNDTKSPLGWRLDRHQHIGEGRIGLRGIALIVNHPRLKDLPFILETPQMGGAQDRVNLERVRRVVHR